MGHLISASALRIGWITTWQDQWYVEKPYYVNYLYSIFRIRFYLIYIFSRKKMERTTIFYSHFEILKHYKHLKINIYYYIGKLEESFFDWKFAFFLQWYYDPRNRDPETRWSQKRFKPYRILTFWHLFDIKLKYKKIINSIEEPQIRKFFRKFTETDCLNREAIITFFKKRKFFTEHKLQLIYVWCYFTIYKEMMSSMKKSVYAPRAHHFSVLKRYFMYIKVHKNQLMHTKILVYFLKMIMFKFVNMWDLVINVYLLANENVTAKFLSRYIARKLQQNFPLKRLLKPIIKELRLVAKSTCMPKSVYFRWKYEATDNLHVSFLYKRNKFKLILMTFISIFNTRNGVYFFEGKSWFTLNLLEVYIWFNSINNVTNFKMLFKYYFINKCYFLCFFEKAVNNKDNKFLPTVIDLNSRVNFQKVLYTLMDYFSTSKWSLFSWISYNEPDIAKWKYACMHLNRYLKFQYWNFNYINWSMHATNNLKSRSAKYSRLGCLKGFKIQLLGRFKRKQRASKYWTSRGTVPLNTISAIIDYGYYTIPLINSAITVKVWLHKIDIDSNLYYQKIT